MAFQYRPRSASDWDRRANQRGGEFEGFLRDDFKLFKPKKGSNAVRFLPPTFDGADHFGIDVYVHWNVGPNKASVLCLQSMRNERCPMCEAYARKVKLGEGEDEEVKRMKAKKSVLVWLLDRNDEDAGPLLWAMPYSIDKDLALLAKDKQTGAILNIDDPDNGYDVYFDKSGEGILTKYQGKELARRSSPVDDAALDFIEEHPLPDCLVWRTYQEIKELYEGGAEPEPSLAEPRPRRNGSGGAAAEASHSNGHAEETVSRRRTAPPDDQPVGDQPTTTRRRAAPVEDAPRTRREEVPHVDEDTSYEPPPKNTADRLRDRYPRR